jgi:hypothetical protein
MKYAPQGRRGAVLARGHTSFKVGPLLETMAALNDESMLVVQVETKEAVERLDDILSGPRRGRRADRSDGPVGGARGGGSRWSIPPW